MSQNDHALDADTRRRAERLIAPGRLSDPYPDFTVEDAIPAIRQLVLDGRV